MSPDEKVGEHRDARAAGLTVGAMRDTGAERRCGIERLHRYPEPIQVTAL